MNEPLKISVITPSFNSAKSIERAIKSVLEQDYKNWEHVIVDGASTDGTVEILKKYQHLKWVSEKDKSQEEAMNKGFARSAGEVIVYLNADDYFFPGAFSAVIEEFKRGAEFVVGNVLVKSPRLQTEFLNTPRTSLAGMLRHWEPNAFCHNPVGYFYLREVQQSFPINENSYAIQDLEFLLNAASKYNFTKIEKTLGCFEDGTDTKTAKTQSRLDYWQPRTFPFLEKHIAKLSEEQRISYEDDRRLGYAGMQARMNQLNREALSMLPAKDLPMISVIIPSYNCAAYVCRAVDSVLSQGLEKLEIIVVDDASTDNTVAILEKQYHDNSSVIILKHETNQMLGASRNTGLDQARGKYVFFLDADDWLEPGALVHLIIIAETYQAEVVECGAQKVWSNGKKRLYHAHDFATAGGKDALAHFADYRIGSIAWNKLYLRDFIEKNHLRFIVPFWYEDVMFTIQIAYLASEYISISNVYCNYFQRDDSYMAAKPTLLNLRSNIHVYLAMTDFIAKIGLGQNAQERLLAGRIFQSHCSNDVFPKMQAYMRTRSKEEWERDVRVVCHELLGVNGFAVADIILATMNHPEHLFSRSIPSRWRGALKEFLRQSANKHLSLQSKQRLKKLIEKIPRI